jgi:hypothetical protein
VHWSDIPTLYIPYGTVRSWIVWPATLVVSRTALSESIMDIERWLNETAEVEPLPKPTHTSGSNFFQPPATGRPVFKDKRARKRTKSDSSLLVPHPHSYTAPKEPTLPNEEGSGESTHSEESHPSHNSSIESASLSQHYARKPRRKTRPERYEPKQPKERGQHIHQSRRNELKRSRRKSKGKKGEKLDSGVAQTFHAKNVSRDRLTVRAAGHAVICNHTDDWVVAEAEREARYIQQGQDINNCPGPWS